MCTFNETGVACQRIERANPLMCGLQKASHMKQRRWRRMSPDNVGYCMSPTFSWAAKKKQNSTLKRNYKI